MILDRHNDRCERNMIQPKPSRNDALPRYQAWHKSSIIYHS